MSDAGSAVTIPFSVVVPTLYGQMIVNRNDINQTNPLFKIGRAVDHDLILSLAQILGECGPDPVLLDIGANIGTYSLGLARAVGPRGKIHAFEPQRIIFNMLAGSVALNSLTNVYCYNMAVGDREGSIEVPQFDYSKALNFGSVEFGTEQREQLNQARGHDPESIEHVPLTTIDRFSFERVDVMKIDVEGMEMQVLLGARDTIRRCSPVLLVEFIKSERDGLRQHIDELGYDAHAIGGNFLGIPPRLRDRIHVANSSGANSPG